MKRTAANARPTVRAKMALPAIFLLVALGVALVGIWPTSRNITKAKADITKLQEDLKRQNTLSPINRLLIQQKKMTLPDGISVNQIQPLKRDDLANLTELFENVARDAKVELVSVTPQARSLKDKRRVLQVDTRMRGDFLTFNTLLSKLNEKAFVDTIETLSIDVTKLGPEMNLSVWLAIQ